MQVGRTSMLFGPRSRSRAPGIGRASEERRGDLPREARAASTGVWSVGREGGEREGDRSQEDAQNGAGIRRLGGRATS